MSDAPVMATLVARPGGGGEAPETAGGRLLQWLPDGSLLTVIVPPNRGPEPQEPAVPTAPIIRRSRDKETPTATQPFLLRTPNDERLFKYYTTAQLAIVAPGRAPRPIGPPAMYLDYWVSPDGKSHPAREHRRAVVVSRRRSSSFGRRLEVIDLDGKVLAEMRRRPLQEAQIARRRSGRRQRAARVAWRPDGKGLSMLLARACRRRRRAAITPRKDRVMLLAPPFAMASAQTIVSTEHRISNVRYSKDGRYAIMTLSKRSQNGRHGDNRDDLIAFDLTASPPAPFVLKANIDTGDPLKLPGDPMTTATGNGDRVADRVGRRRVGVPAGRRLQGRRSRRSRSSIASSIRTGATTPRVRRRGRHLRQAARGARRRCDAADRVAREQDDACRTAICGRASAKQMENLTNNKDPYPEITAAQRVDFEFTRRDGVKVRGRISLPVELSARHARAGGLLGLPARVRGRARRTARGAIRARNVNAYSPLSFLRWSDIWLTQGYALVYPDIPILGKDGKFNDNFRPHLVDTIYAAIRKVDEMGYVDVNRIGHGGHSYGAFTTGNLLAHTPFFKAGIAGDGAYNRTLTPMTFQGERRNFWDAPKTYMEMSPFFYADQINAPLLMYHGAQDNNSGTFLIQSERMMQALTGLGKTAVLYIYPFESHAPRARENFLDLWARWLEWFDKYVKNAPPAADDDGAAVRDGGLLTNAVSSPKDASSTAGVPPASKADVGRLVPQPPTDVVRSYRLAFLSPTSPLRGNRLTQSLPKARTRPIPDEGFLGGGFMLYEFITLNRDEIIRRCRAKVATQIRSTADRSRDRSRRAPVPGSTG